MTTKQVETMWLSITKIEAQAQLNRMTAGDFVNMKQADREKYHREIYSMAHPEIMAEKNYITAEEAMFMLGSHGQ